MPSSLLVASQELACSACSSQWATGQLLNWPCMTICSLLGSSGAQVGPRNVL